MRAASNGSRDPGEPPPRKSRPLLGRRSPLIDLGQFALFGAFFVWLILRGAGSLEYNWQWYRVPPFFYRIVDGDLIWGELIVGLGVTLELAAWCTVFTLLTGLVTAILRMSDSLIGHALATTYLEVIRNTPLLVQLYLFYFVFSPILGIDRFWTGVLCLTAYEGTFVAEIVRAGILSVDKGQWEASDSIGLSRRDSYRYVVLPQAIPLMLPPLTGQIVNLIKHSAIVSVIAVADLTTQGRNVISDTFLSFEIWFTVAAMYLVITVSLSFFVTYLEHKVKVES